MRTSIAASLLLCICTASFAQKKGEMSIGGTVGMSTSLQLTTATSGSISQTEKQPGKTSFQFGPEFSYFVADNCRLTAGIGYGLESSPLSEDDDTGKWLRSNLNVFQIGVGFSYFVSITDRFHYAPGVSFYGVFGKDSIDMTTSSKYSLSAAGFDLRLNAAAFQFRPVKHFAFDISILSLEYAYIALSDKENKDAKLSESGLAFDIAFQPQIGFHYYF